MDWSVYFGNNPVSEQVFIFCSRTIFRYAVHVNPYNTCPYTSSNVGVICIIFVYDVNNFKNGIP